MMHIARLLALIGWVAGIVIAKGFWSTFFALIIPLWSWYLVVEHFLIHYGIING